MNIRLAAGGGCGELVFSNPVVDPGLADQIDGGGLGILCER